MANIQYILIDFCNMLRYTNRIRTMNELEKNKTYVIGNYMIRMNDKGILRITSDKGVILVQPKADNSIEIKYN
nr:MAG TPA: hypothetical protein [Caudoviricetes sp.]